MEIVLECEPDGRTANAMLRKGIDNEDLTMATAITIALAKEAAKGNVAAFKELRDLIGEDGTPGGEVTIVDDL